MRIAQKLSISAATAVLALLAGAAPALAEPHPFVTSFGSFTNPNGIAVEESTSDVYVADIATSTVSKFDANGNPVNFLALATNQLTGAATPAKSFAFPEVPGTPAAIAVDNSCAQQHPALTGEACEKFDPSFGDLYVMDAGHGTIDKFNTKGEYQGQIAGPYLNDTETLTSGPPLGFAVEANGDVRVAIHLTSGGQWDLFDDTAANNLLNTALGVGVPYQHGFALAPNGDSYVRQSGGSWEKAGGSLQAGFPYVSRRLGLVEGDEVEGEAEGGSSVSAAVDPVTGHLFVDNQSSVVEWDTGGMNGAAHNPKIGAADIIGSAAFVSRFGSPYLLSSPMRENGIAVDGVTGEIYVANPADGKVYVFGSSAPAAAADAATGVSETSASLHGSVDPRGVPVTSCEFEYEKAPETFKGHEVVVTMPVTVFSHRVSCAQSVAQIGSGMSPLDVSADVGGLEPGAVYHFRLVAENASGASPSEGLFATVSSGFGFKSFEVSFLNQDGSPDTQAGSHPFEMITHLVFKLKAQREVAGLDSPYVLRPDGTPKDIVVVPPPGFVG